MSYRLIDSNAIAIKYPEVNEMPCVFANLPDGMNGQFIDAQPERKPGKWLPDNRPGGGFWVCSECKFPSEAFAANVLYKFCPNCGAKMTISK